MKRLLPLALIIATAPAVADIYKYYDEQGNLVFSDQRNPAGKDEVVDLKPLNTVPAQPLPSLTPSISASKQLTPKELYSAFAIESPLQQESVRANDGNVSINLFSEPPLDVGAGDIIKLFLDGQPAAQGISAHILLENLDRGEHSVHAVILDADGQTLAETPTHTFFVQRFSAIPSAGSAN